MLKYTSFGLNELVRLPYILHLVSDSPIHMGHIATNKDRYLPGNIAPDNTVTMSGSLEQYPFIFTVM